MTNKKQRAVVANQLIDCICYQGNHYQPGSTLAKRVVEKLAKGLSKNTLEDLHLLVRMMKST